MSKLSPERHAEVWLRDNGYCRWPGCGAPAFEVAHLHSKGMGGTPDGRRNQLSNLMLACADHARMTDGLYASGGRPQYEADHRRLLGPDWKRLRDSGALAWERAEALSTIIANK